MSQETWVGAIPTEKKCNVLMRDVMGNHRLNWDFQWNTTLREIMNRYGFVFEENSVMANAVKIEDKMLDLPLKVLLEIPKIADGYHRTKRLLIVGAVKPEPKNPANNAEEQKTEVDI